MATGIRELKELSVKEMKISKKIRKLIKAIITLGSKHHKNFGKEFKELIERNRALNSFRRKLDEAERTYFASFVGKPQEALRAQQQIVNYLILYRNELLKIAHILLEKRGALIDLNKWMRVLLAYIKEEEELTQKEIALLKEVGLM